MSTPGKPTWQETCPRFKPILGAGIKRDMTMDEFFSHVLYPVIATPKFDGIRCVTVPGERTAGHESVPVCRSMDDVPNHWIFNTIATWCPPGLDGEIMTYNKQSTLFEKDDGRARPFYQVQSDVMSFQGEPLFKFHVFDYHDFSEQYPHLTPYETRLEKLKKLELPEYCIHVPWRLCGCREDIEKFESEMVEAGYEGICWRHVLAKYKYGRSTLREQHLIKMKRFLSSEAVVTGFYEEMHNANEATMNPLGYQERSSHQSNMVGKGRLGGLILKSLEFELEFRCGSGFNSSQREEYWSTKETLVGQTVTFKHQPHGAKDRPRIPIFLGIRDKRDL